jgi:hypothetical protein
MKMSMKQSMTMEIESLIRELIQEDQFKAKYTLRQRSIFCKNMYQKISKFLKSHEEELKDTRDQLVDAHHLLIETHDKLVKSRDELRQYRREYRSLKQKNQYHLAELIYSILNIAILVYFYYSIYRWIINSMQTDQLPKQRQIM